MTRVVTTPAEWRSIHSSSDLKDHSVGFVPTMGALHAGHLSLIERSQSENDHTVVSIFINSTQFDDKNDLASYPRDMGSDMKLLEEANVAYCFVPNYDDIYPDNYRFAVTERNLSRKLCGAHRPGHFDGVLTVVGKLLNIIRPTRAYFGQKDYQQYLLVRDMAEALFMSVEVVPCEIVREPDGLAMSSRNVRLSMEARKLAAEFARVLRTGASNDDVTQRLAALEIEVDYVEEMDERRLAAVTIDGVRLIDNVPL
ncbi:MAG: pantoate--beta-alanine ligase [Gemmatimonadota bacterium]|nr:pantoate--beta-alanine ligase [Gemmatimonadota bacterium]